MYSDNIYETVIIGAGMAGIGSAYQLSKESKNNFLIIENSGNIGGHVMTIKGPQKDETIDIGVQFGNYNYHTLVNIAKEFNIPLVPMTMLYSSGNEKILQIYSNSKNNENNNLYKQVLKWNKITKKYSKKNNYPWWWYITTFGTWCWYYGFTDSFIDYCIKPVMSLLMLMRPIKNESSVFIIEATNDMLYLTNPGYSKLWTVYGGINMLPQIIAEKLDLFSKCLLNTQVVRVDKIGDIYNILIKNNKNGRVKNIMSKRVICATSAPTANVILKNVMSLQQQMYIDRALKYYTPFITVLHRDKSVMNGSSENVYYYYQKLPNDRWRSSGKLSFGWYLSASQWLEELDNISGEKRVVSWNYPMMSSVDIAYIFFLNVIKYQKGNNIQFAGGWTKFSSMEGAFESGMEAVKRF